MGMWQGRRVEELLTVKWSSILFVSGIFEIKLQRVSLISTGKCRANHMISRAIDNMENVTPTSRHRLTNMYFYNQV